MIIIDPLSSLRRGICRYFGLSERASRFLPLARSAMDMSDHAQLKLMFMSMVLVLKYLCKHDYIIA